jgi:hypothetical protein
MKATDELDNIWQGYQVTNDCLKIASRSIDIKDLNILKKTRFMTSTIDDAKKDIKESRDNADNYVILSLWVAFERNLFEYLSWESKRILNNNPSILTQKVHEKIENELEYWRIDDMLNIFKAIIDPQVVGQAKQVKQYRDWIAHKNPKKSMPQIVTPKMAYSVLSEITRLLENHPDVTNQQRQDLIVRRMGRA